MKEYPARLLKLAPTEELKRRALQDSAFDDAVFEELKPFFFSAEISNNRMDSYFTKMATSSLQNYANDAKAGISLLDSHNSRRLGVGKSLGARYEVDGDVERVIADFYTVRDIKFNDATYESTNDFINAIRAGIAQDVSIGFYGGEEICSICKVDMWDWEKGCRHYPGDEVEIKDLDTGVVTGKETVYASVVNARLAEVSLVYDGSTPGAMILKAERAIAEGMMTVEKLQSLETRHRFKLPDARIVGKSKQEEVPMNEPNKTEPTEQERSNSGSSLSDVQIRDITELVSRSGASKDLTLTEQVRWLVDERTRLIPLADDGKAYRDDLITEALAEGVRAVDGFTEETYKAMLTAAPIATIKRMRDDWKGIGDKRFPGGRKTVDEVDETTNRQTPTVNPAAFRA